MKYFKGVVLMKKTIKIILLIAIVSAVLHYSWEYWQCDIFYTMGSDTNHTLLMLSATFGDVMMTIALYLLLSFVNRNFNWVVSPWHSKDYVIITLYALFLSFYFEISALFTNRWGYSDAMPLIPTTNIGMVPVIQLLILFPLTFLISKYIVRLFNKFFR